MARLNNLHHHSRNTAFCHLIADVIINLIGVGWQGREEDCCE